MFGFKPLSENEHLIKLKKTADSLEKTADSLEKTADSLEKSVARLEKTADSLEKSVARLVCNKNGKTEGEPRPIHKLAHDH